jgi:hypothetical protein
MCPRAPIVFLAANSWLLPCIYLLQSGWFEMLSASRRRLREKTTTQQGVLVDAAVVPEVTMPVIAEETWRISLRNTPPWQPPIKSTVVLAPHLDDETLGAGGPVASQRRRGLPVLVVAITEGKQPIQIAPASAISAAPNSIWLSQNLGSKVATPFG